jgi:hypothetical protein
MIWWAVIYWLAINTMGVGVIVGSMCPLKKEKDISSIEKPVINTENNSHEKYSSDYFKNMVEENNANAMNSILKGISDYFSTKTSNSAYDIRWDTYRKVPFSLLSKTFDEYGIKMFTICDDDFTHKDYCSRYTLRVRIIDKEIIR